MDTTKKTVKKLRTDSQADKKRNDFLIKYFKFIILVVIVAILAGSYVFLLKAKYDQIILAIEESGASNQDEYQNQLKRLGELRRLETAYEDLGKKDIEKINTFLPDETKPENLLAQMEAIILKNGLILKKLSVEPVGEKNQKSLNIAEGEISNAQASEASASVGKIRISMDVGGTDYERFKSLLSVFENNLRLIDIEELSFSPSDKSTHLSMVTYYFKK